MISWRSLDPQSIALNAVDDVTNVSMLNRDGSPEVLRILRNVFVDPRLRRRRQRLK